LKVITNSSDLFTLASNPLTFSPAIVTSALSKYFLRSNAFSAAPFLNVNPLRIILESSGAFTLNLATSYISPASQLYSLVAVSLKLLNVRTDPSYFTAV
jgi:hypothetical protein